MIANYEINVEPYPDFTDWENLLYLRVALVIDNGDGSKTTSRFYGYDYYDNKGIKDIDGNLGTVRVTEYPAGNIKLLKQTPKKITLYAWFEGEDPDCVDTASGVLASIKLSFRQTGGENAAY